MNMLSHGNSKITYMVDGAWIMIIFNLSFGELQS